jgi:hypothetical protein
MITMQSSARIETPSPAATLGRICPTRTEQVDRDDLESVSAKLQI